MVVCAPTHSAQREVVTPDWITTGYTIGPDGTRIALGYTPAGREIVQPTEQQVAKALEEYEEK